MVIELAKSEAAQGLPLGVNYPGLQFDLRLNEKGDPKSFLLEQLAKVTDSPKKDVHRIMALLASTVGMDSDVGLYNLFAKSISDYLDGFSDDKYKHEVSELWAARSCCNVGRTMLEAYVLAKERLAENLKIFNGAIDDTAQLEEPKLPSLLY